MATPGDSFEIHPFQATLIERFRAVLYPIDLVTLFDLLPQQSWIVPSRRFDEQGNQRLDTLPSKGNARLRADPGNKTIGVDGNDVSEVLKVFRELREFVRKTHDLSPEVVTDYVEFRYIGWAKGSSNPAETFRAWWGGSERVSSFGALLAKYLPAHGNAFGPYGLRFALSGLDANRPNWGEVQIVPQNISGHLRYAFDILFRDEVAAVAEGVAEQADDLLRAALRHLEARR